MRSLKKSIWNLLNLSGLGGIVQLFLRSALKDYGWFRSFHTKQSVDAQGNPLPWYTYPFIFFLAPRISAEFDVFEYGSGNSTRWYAGRVRHITAVEHEAEWVKIVSQKLPANARVLTRSLGDDYVRAIGESSKKYHIVIVDGRKRVKCTLFAVDYLTEDGVLILDNSDRPWYAEAKEWMNANGFRQLDFQGMVPIEAIHSQTTVFYRDGNCLGI